MIARVIRPISRARQPLVLMQDGEEAAASISIGSRFVAVAGHVNPKQRARKASREIRWIGLEKEVPWRRGGVAAADFHMCKCARSWSVPLIGGGEALKSIRTAIQVPRARCEPCRQAPSKQTS